MKNAIEPVGDLAETLLTKLLPPGHFPSQQERFFVAGLLAVAETFLKPQQAGQTLSPPGEALPVYDMDRRSQIVGTFMQNLEKHVAELGAGQTDLQLRVSDFAAMQNLHENYLNAVIKAKIGKTAKACISEKIVGEASRLLLRTTLSNKEISYRLGFVECSHFNAYFKKYTGVTPQRFRQIHYG